MGTWDVGPFDNDTAADWCGELDDAATDRRAGLVRDALTAVVDRGDDYVDSDQAVEAVAAAAVVASQVPGGYPISSAYAPGFLRDGGTLDISGELRRLAVLALDRVVGDNSEWRELWEEAADYPNAVAALQSIRASLERGEA